MLSLVPGCTALVTSAGCGIPHALTIKGRIVMPMGTLNTEGATGERGAMRYGTRFMFPPGGNGPLTKAQIEHIYEATGVRYSPKARIRQHGIVQTVNSEVIRQEPHIAEFHLAYPGTEEFPWSFVLWQTAGFMSGRFIRSTTISNSSSQPMPVAIGWHEYFAVTAQEGESLDSALRNTVIEMKIQVRLSLICPSMMIPRKTRRKLNQQQDPF